ncbi:uncharacterized protein METZ01_LOCUS413556, partial [marine metagenome]
MFGHAGRLYPLPGLNPYSIIMKQIITLLFALHTFSAFTQDKVQWHDVTQW